MRTLIKSKTEGFTLIEVVLVLAIAGLIFLIVFLALPALQRSQRDTQRKNDLSRLMSQVTNYQSNNQGALPNAQAGWNTFVSNYMTNSNQTFSDPQSGSTYGVELQLFQTAKPAVGQIFIYINSRCDPAESDGLNTGSGGRSFAGIVFQEQGGYYCQSN